MRQVVAVRWIIAPCRRPHQRAQQSVDGLRILLQPGFAESQHLFDASSPDALADRHGFSEARFHRRAAPRFARDETVYLARMHRLDRQ